VAQLLVAACSGLAGLMMQAAMTPPSCLLKLMTTQGFFQTSQNIHSVMPSQALVVCLSVMALQPSAELTPLARAALTIKAQLLWALALSQALQTSSMEVRAAVHANCDTEIEVNMT
jgi:hypothetical protein